MLFHLDESLHELRVERFNLNVMPLIECYVNNDYSNCRNLCDF